MEVAPGVGKKLPSQMISWHQYCVKFFKHVKMNKDNTWLLKDKNNILGCNLFIITFSSNNEIISITWKISF
jgi:hypothetical protein